MNKILDKPKVLIFTDWYAPGFKAGGPIQSCKNLVRQLADSFQFYVVTSDTDFGESKPYPDIETSKWIAGKNKEQIFYCNQSDDINQLIPKFVEQFNPESIYLNSMFSKRFTLSVIRALGKISEYNGKVVLAPRGMLHKNALALKKTKKMLFIRFFNWFKVPERLVFHATDNQESKDIRKIFPSTKEIIQVSNVPNVKDELQPPVFKRNGDLKAVFIARIHPTKNLKFILDFFKEVYYGNITFDVYGSAKDPSYLQECKKIIEDLPENIQVEIKGPLVHTKVFPTLEQYHLFILPTLGENFGHSIFEAFTVGRPVLISDQTPWLGLKNKKAGWELPLNDKEAFTDVIKAFVDMEDEEFKSWCHGARAFSEEFMSNAHFNEQYKGLFL